MGLQRLGGDEGKGVEGRAHRLAHRFEPVKRAYSVQDMRRIGALGSTLLEQPASFDQRDHFLEHPLFSFMSEQASTEVSKHAGVKGLSIEGQVEGVLPVEPRGDSAHCCSIRPVFEALKDGDEGKQDRGNGGLALSMIEVGELLIMELLVETVADQAVGAVWRQMPGSPRGDLI